MSNRNGRYVHISVRQLINSRVDDSVIYASCQQKANLGRPVSVGPNANHHMRRYHEPSRACTCLITSINERAGQNLTSAAVLASGSAGIVPAAAAFQPWISRRPSAAVQSYLAAFEDPPS